MSDRTDIASEEPQPGTAKRVLRIGLRVLFILFTIQLVAVAFIILALQTRWGAEQIRRIVIHQANLTLMAEVEVGRLGGNFFSRLHAYDVRLIQDGHVTARIDTVIVSFRALPLLWRTVHLTDVYIAQPEFYGVQGPDTVWNFQRLVEPAEPDTVPTPWRVRIKQFEMRNGTASMNFYTPAGDSIVLVDDLQIDASDFFVSAENFFVTVDSMWARARAPDSPSPVYMNLAASYQEDFFSVGGFALSSDSSNVFARGYIPLYERLETDSLFFIFEAHPFATRDLRAFFPALDLYGTIDGVVRLQGYNGLASASVRAGATDGSEIDLEAVTTLRNEGPQIYQASGTISRLNPAHFTRDPSMAGLINAAIEADLTGATADQISGTSLIEVIGSQWQGVPIRDSQIEARFDDGAGQFTLDSGIGNSVVTVRGTGRFFDERPTYAASGRVERLDLADLTGDPADRSNINFRFGVSGDGIDPDDLVATGALDVQPTTVSDVQIDAGRLEASMAAGRLAFDARARMLDGAIAASGEVHPLEEDIRYRIARGSFSNLNLAALTDDPETTSELSGTFALAGQGTDPDRMVMQADLQIFDSRYDQVLIQSASLSASVRNRVLDFSTQASLDAGALEAAGTVRPFDEEIAYDVPHGRFTSVDLSRFADDPQMQTDLSGAFRVRGVGTDPEVMSADVRLDLDRSRYRDVVIDLLTLDAQMREGGLAMDLDMESTAGNVHLTGSVQPFADEQAYSITQGIFRDLDLGPWIADPGLNTDLTGSLLIEGRGLDPQTAEAEGRIQLDPSVINREEISSGIATLNMAGGQTHMYIGFQTETGLVDVTTTGRFFDEVPTYYVSGNIMNVNVDRLAGMPDLNTRMTVWFQTQGAGFDLETMEATGWILGYDSQLFGGRVDTLSAEFSIVDARLVVDTLLVAGEVFNLDAGGVLALDPDLVQEDTEFVFTMEIFDAGPMRPLIDAEYLAAEGEIDGRVTGSLGRVRFEAEADLLHVAYNDIRLGRMISSLAGEYTDELQFTSHTQVDNLSLPTLFIERTDVEVFYTPDVISLDGDFRIDRARSASFNASFATLEDEQRLEIESLALDLEEDRYELLQPALVVIVGEQYRISNFLLASNGQQIAADGVVDFAGEQSAVLTIESVELGPFADLFQYEQVRGVVDATFLMSGPAEAPILTGTLTVDDLEVQGRDAGDVRIELNYEEMQLALDVLMEYAPDQNLTAEGTIPMDLALVDSGRPPRDSDVELQIVSNRYPIRVIQPFLDPETVGHIDGLLTATVDVGGQLDNPQLSGDVTFREGVLTLPDLGVTYSRMEIDAVLEGNQARIDRAQFRSGRGGMTATGTIDLAELALDQMAFNLDLAMTNFEAANTVAYRVVTAGDLQLRGTYTRPELYGAIVLEQANFNLSEELTGMDVEDVALTERDLQIVEARFGVRVDAADTVRFDFYDAMTMELSVRIERNVWLRSRQAPRMSIEFIGMLDLTKNPFEDLLAFGEIETTERSNVSQFGRRFDITTGQLVFNGPVTDPTMDIVAEYRVRSRTRAEYEAVITLTLEGTLDDLRPEISSDPPMEMTDILAYIATGRPAGEGFFGGGETEAGGFLGTSTDFARGFVTGQMYTLFEGFAATELGLDVIDIEQDPFTNETILTAGKYISNDIFASLSRPLTRGRRQEEGTLTQFLIEYEAYRFLLLRLSRRTAGVGANLLWEYAY